MPVNWRSGRVGGRRGCNFAQNPGHNSCLTGGDKKHPPCRHEYRPLTLRARVRQAATADWNVTPVQARACLRHRWLNEPSAVPVASIGTTSASSTGSTSPRRLVADCSADLSEYSHRVIMQYPHLCIPLMYTRVTRSRLPGSTEGTCRLSRCRCGVQKCLLCQCDKTHPTAALVVT